MWSALQDLCPECFHEPRKYLLLKSQGAFVVHTQLVNLLPSLHHMKNYTKGQFYNILSHESVADIFNSHFWESKNVGGAAQYGTNKMGIKLLNETIWQQLRTAIEDLDHDSLVYQL